MPSSRRDSGREPQAVRDLSHQVLQIGGFGLDGHQECMTIAVAELMVVIKDLLLRSPLMATVVTSLAPYP